MEARLETERKAVLDEKRAKRAQLQPLPPAPAPKSVEDDLIHDDDWNGSYQTKSSDSDQNRLFQTLLNSCFLDHQVDFVALLNQWRLHNPYQKSENQT